MVRRYLGHAMAVVLLLTAGWGVAARAQGRVNDKDLARMLENVNHDAQPFRKSFDSAMKKSTIRGTSQEKDARGLAATFEDQSKHALVTFRKHKKAEDEVAAMVDTAGQIDKLLNSVSLSPVVTQQWEKVRTELHEVAGAVNVPDSYSPRDGQ
ncbi:MAG TPA: hypothetical protein VF126_02030 [Acidobacteriaceae bacterium]